MKRFGYQKVIDKAVECADNHDEFAERGGVVQGSATFAPKYHQKAEARGGGANQKIAQGGRQIAGNGSGVGQQKIG